MTAELGTLLMALCWPAVRWFVATPRRPGRPGRLPDAELVCPAVARVLLGARGGLPRHRSRTAEDACARIAWRLSGHGRLHPAQPGHRRPRSGGR